MRLTGEDPLQLVRIRGDLRLCRHERQLPAADPIEGGYDDNFFDVADALLASAGTFSTSGPPAQLRSRPRLAERVRFHLFGPIPRRVEAIEKTRGVHPTLQASEGICLLAVVPPFVRSHEPGEFRVRWNYTARAMIATGPHGWGPARLSLWLPPGPRVSRTNGPSVGCCSQSLATAR